MSDNLCVPSSYEAARIKVQTEKPRFRAAAAMFAISLLHDNERF